MSQAPTDVLMEAISKWSQRSQRFQRWKRKQIAATLFSDGTADEYSSSNEDFAFSPILAEEHEVLMSFFYVRQVQQTIAQCEYYFRRFPFHGLPMTRDDHLRNMCEFYLSQFYIGEERVDQLIKKTLRKKFPSAVPAFSALLKVYKKQFDRELRARHNITHSAPFDDTSLDRIFLTHILSEDDISNNNVWKIEHLSAYRKMSRKWCIEARRQSQIMSPFVDAMAQTILENIDFLSFNKNDGTMYAELDG